MMPLPRPTLVSNLKMASIALVPARITLRGAARPGAMAKPLGSALRASGGSAFRIASAPFSVWMFQLSASTSRQ